MKEYKKPEMTEVEFKANESIAACEVTESSDYKQQTVNCYIDGSETVFTSGNCTKDTSSGYLVDYDDQTYFVWYNGSSNAKPSAQQTKLLDTLVKKTGNRSGAGWHAGIATKTLISTLNNS